MSPGAIDTDQVPPDAADAHRARSAEMIALRRRRLVRVEKMLPQPG